MFYYMLFEFIAVCFMPLQNNATLYSVQKNINVCQTKLVVSEFMRTKLKSEM